MTMEPWGLRPLRDSNERVERYFLEEQQREEDERRREEEELKRREEVENQIDGENTSQISTTINLAGEPGITPNDQGQARAHVYVPRARYVVSMNTRDFSSVVAAELRDIYMERYNLNPRDIPGLRRRRGIVEDSASAYDDAQAVLEYSARIEQRNRERLRRGNGRG